MVRYGEEVPEAGARDRGALIRCEQLHALRVRPQRKSSAEWLRRWVRVSSLGEAEGGESGGFSHRRKGIPAAAAAVTVGRSVEIERRKRKA